MQAAGLAPDIATIANVFSEVIAAPAIPHDAIVREKASQKSALEEALQDPLHTGFSTLRKTFFSGTGYGLDPLGTSESLATLDRDALLAHHARHFNAANHSTVVFAAMLGKKKTRTYAEMKRRIRQPIADLLTDEDPKHFGSTLSFSM